MALDRLGGGGCGASLTACERLNTVQPYNSEHAVWNRAAPPQARGYLSFYLHNPQELRLWRLRKVTHRPCRFSFIGATPGPHIRYITSTDGCTLHTFIDVCMYSKPQTQASMTGTRTYNTSAALPPAWLSSQPEHCCLPVSLPPPRLWFWHLWGRSSEHTGVERAE